jgi:Zn-dependent peptidase ImmA (M78 family)
LLFHTSGIDPQDRGYIDRLAERSRNIEVLCNRFAAEFLLPEKAFEAALADLRPDERSAEILAARFHVSREFIFRQFVDRDLIAQDEYVLAARRWADQKQEGEGGEGTYSFPGSVANFAADGVPV